MLATISVTAAVLAAVMSLRWVLTRIDAIGRVRPFPTVSVAVAAALTVGCAVPVFRHALFEQRLARVASILAGARVEVHCQTLGQAWTDAHTELGYVPISAGGRPQRRTVIAWKACADIGAWTRTHAASDLDQVIALHVLSHEAMHMAGTVAEAVAECAAVQRDALTARELGASREQALAVARRYWREVYPLMPTDYRSTDCVPGGALDEHLPDPPWGG